jgi:hypothetical protein
MSIRILLPALILLAACDAKPADPLAEATRRVAHVDSLRQRTPDAVRMWASVPERGLVAVRDTLSWPDEMDTSINLWVDGEGRPAALVEAPVSESGDWFAEFTHWFGEDGRTVAFEWRASSFSSGCTEIVRDTRRTFYGPDFQPLRADSTHTDGDGRPLAADCQSIGDFSELALPAPTYQALAAARRAPPLASGGR